ncbi:unnamed protein product, partial [Allacma fusca]
RTKVTRKDEEEYFRILRKSNPDMIETDKSDSFVPDDKDWGTLGWPSMKDSEAKLVISVYDVRKNS